MKCPNCNNEIYAIDTLDSDFYGYAYYDLVEATCPNCGLTWQWKEVFTFDHVEDIRQVNENDHP